MEEKTYYVVDLFAGSGGLSEGFKQVGFDILAEIEMDKWACDTLRTRQLFYGLKKAHKSYLYQKYLREELQFTNLLESYKDLEVSISHRVIQSTFGKDSTDDIIQRIEASKMLHGANHYHVVLGGPPCQPYSVVGRARDPFRMEKDNRHFLYRYYLEILECLQPDFFVYENVPGLFTARSQGREIFSKMLEDFSLLHPPYEITPPFKQIYEDPCSYILNSADFKVPQRRKRLILIGFKKSLDKINPELRDLFTKLQKKALKNRKKGLLTVDDAIGDLPSLRPGEGNDGWFGYYKQNQDLKGYQIKMRKDSRGILNHKARTHMRSDLERYKFFIEHHKNGNGSTTLRDLNKFRPELIPNHRHLDKFFDRFRVQWWNRPSSTITAHISKDGHYYIHPDIDQCRSFTVREAARCQSFPDNFKFEGSRTQQFRQVGNAVPPLFAFEIARILMKELRRIYES